MTTLEKLHYAYWRMDTVKRAWIGHHLKIAAITALLAGLYFAGVLTPALYRSYTDGIRAEAIQAYQAGN